MRQAADPAPGVEVVGDDAAARLRHRRSRSPVQRAVVRRRAISRAAPARRRAVPRPEREQRRVDRPAATRSSPTSSFRGFAASPLLGTPQGLSVFQDGVRINEAFADVVNWDLLPQNAIASIAAAPGIGSGLRPQHAGRRARALHEERLPLSGRRRRGLGRIVRPRASPSRTAGAAGALDGFVAGEALNDAAGASTRDAASGSMFARGDWRDGPNEANVARDARRQPLNGTQALPLSMLDNPRQPYTWPDTTTTAWHSSMREVQPRLRRQLVAANAYCRQLTTSGHQQQRQRRLRLRPTSPSEASTSQSATSHPRRSARRCRRRVRHGRGTSHIRSMLGVAVDAGRHDFRAKSQQPATFVADRETIGTGPFVPTPTSRRRRAIWASMQATRCASGPVAFLAGRPLQLRARRDQPTAAATILPSTARARFAGSIRQWV